MVVFDGLHAKDLLLRDEVHNMNGAWHQACGRLAC